MTEEEGRCGVCYEDFTVLLQKRKRRIRSIPCGHSLCSLCLDNLTKNECPFCRHRLNPNFRTVSPVNFLAESFFLKKPCAVGCDSKSISPAPAYGEICKDHLEQVRNIFCEDCKVYVCSKCCDPFHGAFHTGHFVRRFEVAVVEKVKSEVVSEFSVLKLQELSEKVKQLQGSCGSFEKILKSDFSKIASVKNILLKPNTNIDDLICAFASFSNTLEELGKEMAVDKPCKFEIGDVLEVFECGDWVDAEILDIKDGKAKIHYNGCQSTWDEWIAIDSKRLSKKS